MPKELEFDEERHVGPKRFVKAIASFRCSITACKRRDPKARCCAHLGQNSVREFLVQPIDI